MRRWYRTLAVVKVVWPPDGWTLPRRALLAAMEDDAAAAKRMSRTETRIRAPGWPGEQSGMVLWKNGATCSRLGVARPPCGRRTRIGSGAAS